MQFGYRRVLFVLLVCLPLLTYASLMAAPGSIQSPQGCCVGTRGNVNGQGIIDISDLSLLVDYIVTIPTPTLPCPDAANVNGKGIIDLSDLSLLVDYLITTPAPSLPPCFMSFETRKGMFDSLKVISDALDAVPRDSLARAYLNFFKRRSEFAASGIENGVSVWACFADGRLLIVPNNRMPDDPVIPDPGGALVESQPPINETSIQPKSRSGSSEMAQPTAPIQSMAFDTTYELPNSVTAFIGNTLSGMCFTSCLATVKSMLENNGYITTVGKTVDELRNVKNFGFFYIDAHCGPGYDLAHKKYVAIWTATDATDAGDLKYDTMLTNKELVYMWARDFDGFRCRGSICRYAFTGAFVAQYMSFTPHSFVYISACQSDDATLKAGFKAAGASVYTSWTYDTKSTPSNKAGLFVIERMLGIPWPSLPTYAAPEENPLQRPFDLTQLWEDMKQRHYDTCLIVDTVKGVITSTVSYFTVSKLQGDFELLAPSIRYMQVLPRTDTVEMTGYFGSDPGSKGHVKVNGVERTVLSWEPWIIKFSLPASGPGSAGPVIVELDPISGPSAPERRKSNVVNLTDWRIPFTYMEINAGTLKCSLIVNVHIRADVHSFREYPHQLDPKPNQYIVFGGIKDASGGAGAAGTFTYHVPDSDPPEDITIDYFGKDTLAWYGDITPNEGFLYQGFVKYSTQIEWMELQLTASAISGMKRKETSSLQGELSLTDLSISPPQDVYNLTPPPFFGLYLLLSSWDILSGANPATKCCKEYPDETDMDIEMKWPHIAPTFKPDPNAPR